MIAATAKPVPGPDQGDQVKAIGALNASAPPIFLHESVLEEILDYSHGDLQREQGGFLVGDLYEDRQKQYVEVRHFCAATQARSHAASFTFTHETWSAAQRDIDRRFPGERIVGWHHTHPDLGVFLSGYDRFIHRNFFAQPWESALVVDPLRQEFGFFQWLDGEIVSCGFVCVYGK
ncbi:Mov34/MPN/PAD-1 family protein [Lignipirellula cremea]|uniref:Mov34/MPN/PAD-1 family protein n=1 Tax=Lignipirellula cremea TaxID=2528010 RepID=A0A518DXZ2_9BACT|nr:Mov34/MPN/PAD-1 family protein [Lignipirellula cremea]QDU96709.1 Mov34/MPN/PAD-1 family protein [Lignipirellula cremea]